MSDTPLSQLVLWVPPAIAAGWEHLPAARQAVLTQEMVRWLTSRMLPPSPPERTLEWITSLSVEDLATFVKELEEKFRRMAEEKLW